MSIALPDWINPVMSKNDMELSVAAKDEATRLVGSHWTTLDIFTPANRSSIFTVPQSQEALAVEEIDKLTQLFSSREFALRAGLVLRGTKYDVHYWETVRNVELVYGRTGDAVSGAGACVGRIATRNSFVYAVVRYDFPSLSANAVTELVRFSREKLASA